MKATQQFDPIVSVTPLPVIGGALSPSDALTASVFVSSTGDDDANRIGSMTAPSFRDRLRRRYWHYELDMAHHPVVLRFALPARQEACAFSATVTLLWAVRDPIEVSLLGVRDLRPVLWTFLNQTLRGVSRQFDIEEIQAAETEMRLILEKHSSEIGFGLRLPMTAVSLRLDEETVQYLSQRVRTGREGNLADDRHGLALQEAEYQERETAWRLRMERDQAEWRGRSEMAEAMHQRNLEEQQALHRRHLDAAQADHIREIERLNTDHETELRKQRLAFYREVLGGGDYDVVVLQLIENPGDMDTVVKLLGAGGDKHFDRAHQILDKLVQHKLTAAADVEELTQHAIGELRTALSAAAPRTTRVVEEGVTQRVRTEEKHTDRITRQTTR